MTRMIHILGRTPDLSPTRINTVEEDLIALFQLSVDHTSGPLHIFSSRMRTDLTFESKALMCEQIQPRNSTRACRLIVCAYAD